MILIQLLGFIVFGGYASITLAVILLTFSDSSNYDEDGHPTPPML